MNLSNFINIFDPIRQLVDEVHTSTEEKGKLKQAILAMEAALQTKLLEHQSQILKSQQAVLVAETSGHSWMQRNWRPLTMLVFVGLVVGDMFGLTAYRLPADAWEVIKISLSGYVFVRSGEKVAPMIVDAFKKTKV